MAPHRDIPQQQPPVSPDTATPKRNRLGDLLRMVVFLGIGIFFIYWFLLKLDAGQKQAIWQSFLEADYGWVAVAVAVSLLSHFVRAMRWRLLYESIGYRPSPSHIFGSVIVGYMANLAFPRAGEVVRCATLRTSENIPLEKSIGTVVTERLIDMLVFVLIVLVGMLAMFGQAKDWLYNTLSERFDHLPNMAMIAGAVVAVVVLFAIALLSGWSKFGGFFTEQIWTPVAGRLGASPWWYLGGAFLAVALLIWAIFHWSGSNKVCGKIAGWIKGLGAGFVSIGKMKHKWLFVLYTVLIWTMYVLMSWSGLKALPPLAGLGISDALFISAVGNVASVIPVPGGIGAFHYLVKATLMSLFGATENMGLVYAVFCHESHAIIIIILGIISYIRLTLRKKS